jgi:signal transduction histidine kinase
LPLIFNRFYRVDKARGGGPGSNRGAGLGLAITKRIVELHASRIEVQSEPLRGTCFSFCLPLLTEPPAL